MDAGRVPEEVGEKRLDGGRDLRVGPGSRRCGRNRSPSRPHLLACFPPLLEQILHGHRIEELLHPCSRVSHIPCVRHRSIISARAPRLPASDPRGFPSAVRMISPTVIPEGSRARMNPPPGPANALHDVLYCAGAGRAAAGTARDRLRFAIAWIGTGFPATTRPARPSPSRHIAPRVVIFTSRSSPPRAPAPPRRASPAPRPVSRGRRSARSGT